MTTATGDRILVRLEERDVGRVAYVTINDPAKRNRMTSPMKKTFVAAVEALGRDESLRVLVLTGTGDKAFIGGSDIYEMVDRTPATAHEGSALTHRCCDVLRRLPVPVIARINGYCFGAGMEIAACCDMRVAADNAVFGMPEVRVGIPAVVEGCVLPQLIGWGKTRELVYTGSSIDATEAFACGFLERLVSAGELDDAVERWVDGILAGGPRAIRLQKQLVSDWERMAISDAVDRSLRAMADAFTTDEPRRMMSAFIDRRRD